MERPRGWIVKFRNAFRGMGQGSKGQSSMAVHLTSAVIVIVLALLLKVTIVKLLVLLLCICIVLVSEMFNSSLEHLARAVTQEQNEHIRDSLDIASGAVLVASIFAALVGIVIFGQSMYSLFLAS